MSEIVLFDYGQLDVETRITVKQRTEEIKTLVRRSAQDIIDIGNKLIDVKQRLGHGSFGEWLEQEFQWSTDTAHNFMRVADKFGKFPNLGDIGASALYLLAAPSTPEPARLEAIERAEAGETITHTVAKQIVAQHRPTPTPTPQRTLEASIPAFTPPVDRPRPVAEPEPRRPATPPRPTPGVGSRQLTDQEAHAVVWRVLQHHCNTGNAAAPDSLQIQREWLVKADWSLFHGALTEGVRFANGQLLQMLNKVKAELQHLQELSVSATMAIEKPQPAPPIVEPEEEPEKDKDENYTPSYIVEAARAVLGEIDLDPASCALAQKVVKAKTYLTKANDSLQSKIPWLGRVWLNPPFSNPAPFTNKLIEEYEAGRTKAAILLVNNGTETQWGQALLRRPYPVCFVGAHKGGRSRIDFWQSDPDEPRTGNRYAQMIFFLGTEPDKFREVFSQFGVIR